MKTLLRISLVTAALALTGSPLLTAATTDASAATPTPTVRKHLNRHQRVALRRRAAVRRHVVKKLGLTQDQLAKLKADRSGTASAIKAIRADSTLTADQKKAKIRDTVKTARAQMRSVLTQDQQKKLDHIRARVLAAHGLRSL